MTCSGGIARTRSTPSPTQTANDGHFSWAVPADQPEAGDYSIRVRANQGAEPEAQLPLVRIANDGQHYYVNDGSRAGDVFTTAVGSDANSGKSPTPPMATLAALLDAYDLDAGDTVHVDAGTYTLYRNLVIDAQDSGVRIVGPAAVPATLRPRPSGAGQPGLVVPLERSATDVTLASLRPRRRAVRRRSIGGDSDRFTLLERGVPATRRSPDLHRPDQSTTRFSVTGSRPNRPQPRGITRQGREQPDRGNDVLRRAVRNGISSPRTTVRGNARRQHGGSLHLELTESSVVGNTVHDNAVRGITADEPRPGDCATRSSGTALREGYGIVSTRPTNRAEATDNVVYDNNDRHLGAQTTATANTVSGNRVFRNTVGSASTASSNILNNHVYSNSVGIRGSNPNAGFQAVVANNLVYANTNQGI